MRFWKLKGKEKGGHHHVQVFVARGKDQTYANCGTLIMSRDDFDNLKSFYGLNEFEVIDESKVQWWPS